MYRLKLFSDELRSLGKSIFRAVGITFGAILISYFLNFLCKYIDKSITPNYEIPIFVISLDKAKERLNFFNSQLSDYSRFYAVDWREISMSEDELVFGRDPMRMTVPAFVADQSDTKRYVAECLRYPDTKLRLYKKYFRPNDVGCFFSHLALWNVCYKNALDKILVFEDDVVLKPFFRTKLKEFLRKIPQDFDIAFLGYRDSFHSERISRIGMHAYVISLRKEKLRNFISDFYSMFPIDYMVWMASDNLKCYFNEKQILAINEEFKSHEEFDTGSVDSDDFKECKKEIKNFFEVHFK
ncbi:MAG: glycosyltransferase family 25 protein [Alphaproteobacteria bacterium]|nr:glycosyltransferase family 25 protein [Alphaproteobacteria bacterium]